MREPVAVMESYAASPGPYPQPATFIDCETGQLLARQPVFRREYIFLVSPVALQLAGVIGDPNTIANRRHGRYVLPGGPAPTGKRAYGPAVELADATRQRADPDRALGIGGKAGDVVIAKAVTDRERPHPGTVIPSQTTVGAYPDAPVHCLEQTPGTVRQPVTVAEETPVAAFAPDILVHGEILLQAEQGVNPQNNLACSDKPGAPASLASPGASAQALADP